MMQMTGEVAWWAVGGGRERRRSGRRVVGDGGSRFGRGRGRPWGRVARVFLRSKAKVSEWSNFGGERLLGAANGDEPKRRIHGIKSNPVKERSALRAAGRLSLLRQESGRGTESGSEDPRVTPTRGAPSSRLRLGHQAARNRRLRELALLPCGRAGTNTLGG